VALKSIVWPFAFTHKFLPQFDPLRVIDVENGDSGAAGLRSAHERRAEPLKVSLPRLLSRIEKAHDVVRERIATGQIRPLAQITSMAAPGSILSRVGAAVLLRDNMFDMKQRSSSGKVR
jgi:hypothetical protein